LGGGRGVINGIFKVQDLMDILGFPDDKSGKRIKNNVERRKQAGAKVRLS
jgi:hypothetical protein